MILGVTTLASYGLGLLRDRTFATTFGASTSLDSYNAAFLLPDFLFNFLVASAIAAAAIPLFTELRQINVKLAYQYINSLMTLSVITMAVTGLIILFAAPLLTQLVAPGIDQAGQVLVTRLMRVLALSPLLFAASNTLGAMLVAQKRFLFYGLSPVLYNVGIIAGTWYLAPTFGIMGVAYGTVAGALLHLLARLTDSFLSGWHPWPVIVWPIPEFKSTLKLMLPKMVGHPVELVTFWVFTSLASWLAVGSIATLNFARNFQSVPVSIIGIAMATAVFPSLSEAALSGKRHLRQLLWQTTASIFSASAAAAVFVFLIRRPLVGLVLGGGAFDEEAIRRTAALLAVFCLSIPTESLSHLFARAFYATKNTIIPVSFSVASLLVAVGSAYILLSPLGILALPAGFFLGSLLKTIGLLTVFLQRTK